MRFSFFKRKHERGHAMTEMALTLPILLMVVFGIMDFGRVFFLYSQVSNAAREGARYGSVVGVFPQGEYEQYRDCNAIRQAVVDKFGMELNLTPDQITIEYDNGSTLYGFDCSGALGPNPTQVKAGDRIRVTVESNFEFITPFLGSLLPDIDVEFTAARTILKDGILAEPPVG